MRRNGEYIMRHIMAKRRRQDTDRPPETHSSVRRQLALAAGSEGFKNRNPVYHVTENFRMSFDEIGRRHAAELAGSDTGGFALSDGRPSSYAEGSYGRRQTPDAVLGVPDTTGAQGIYQMRYPEYQDVVRRFSEIAFNRGTLAGAVMAGTGKMMLVSCLKRVVGQTSIREQQRRLFEGGSQHMNIPGHTSGSVVFNRGVIDSAVGLVVDTLADARRIVDSMADIAAGQSVMGEMDGAGTLRKLYPFLDDSRERKLIRDYGERLKVSDDPEERHLLQNASVHAQALIQKKAQMKAEFINKLRFISDRSAEALALFETPGFVEEVSQKLDIADEPPEPPPDEPEEGGEDRDASD